MILREMMGATALSPLTERGKGKVVTAHTKITLAYPDHMLDNPAHWVTFIEMLGFTDDWRKLGLTDDDLQVVQGMLGADPKGQPIIRGTGGLRKLRFAPPKKTGRRRWYRVCYVYFEEADIILLIVAYAKNEMDDISAGDRKCFRELIQRERAVFLKRAVK